jgi:hypothetical protein
MSVLAAYHGLVLGFGHKPGGSRFSAFLAERLPAIWVVEDALATFDAMAASALGIESRRNPARVSNITSHIGVGFSRLLMCVSIAGRLRFTNRRTWAPL